jgi:hypothetical protein
LHVNEIRKYFNALALDAGKESLSHWMLRDNLTHSVCIFSLEQGHKTEHLVAK